MNNIEIMQCGNNSGKHRVRKPNAKWSNEKTIQLITAVKIREGLWNTTDRFYRQSFERRVLWQEIADELNLTRDEVMTKWNNIRFWLRTSLNRAKQDGTFAKISPHFKLLQFLIPYLRPDKLSPGQNQIVKEEKAEYSENTNIEFETVPTLGNFGTNRALGVSERNVATKTNIVAPQSTDNWNDIGKVVSSTGRQWTHDDPELANDFKIAIFKLIAKFQERSANHNFINNLCKTNEF